MYAGCVHSDGLQLGLMVDYLYQKSSEGLIPVVIPEPYMPYMGSPVAVINSGYTSSSRDPDSDDESTVPDSDNESAPVDSDDESTVPDSDESAPVDSDNESAPVDSDNESALSDLDDESLDSNSDSDSEYHDAEEF
ncbi:hypothetical protein FB45DRAFT_882432 [Roridomyces roridus]|uniref:Uncharacterized protein n=1 Tax=Roridomyces roridus TaxID=1738132 RepID=A0AAD7AXL8_9AGAR|nr:hypothetical protein FB45DRAFT_882432 [Roridomyces roridus]